MTQAQTTTSQSATQNIKRLSVQISLTGLSFLLEFEDSSNWYYNHPLASGLNPGDVLIQLQEIIQSKPEFQQKAQDVVIVYHHATFCWVPKALLNPDNLADYLKYNAKLLSQDYDVLEARDMVNVYVPFTNVNNYIFDRYGDFTFLHAATVFLAAIAKEYPSQQTQVIANLQQGELLLAITDQQKVLLINSYKVTSPEDFAYYLLFAMQQHNLDGDNIPLHLSGDIKKGDPFYELAYRYVREVSVLSEDNEPLLLKNVAQACE